MFTEATFATDANFAGATFADDALFHGATLGRRITFGDSIANATVRLAELQVTAPLLVTAGAACLAFADVVVVAPLTIAGHNPGASCAIVMFANMTLAAPVTIDEGVTLTTATLLGSTGLEHLRVRGDPAWSTRSVRGWGGPTGTGWRPVRWMFGCGARRFLADELTAREFPQVAAPVARVYRQLRAGLEASKAAPEAADFYYGELEMRRLAAPRLSVERPFLALYKWVGGYGVRAWRPFAVYFAILAVTAAGFRWRTYWWVSDALAAAGADPVNATTTAGKTSTGLRFTRFWDAAAFVARNSVSLLSAPASGLTAGGTFIVIAERLSAVALLALGVLALRSRVQR